MKYILLNDRLVSQHVEVYNFLSTSLGINIRDCEIIKVSTEVNHILYVLYEAFEIELSEEQATLFHLKFDCLNNTNTENKFIFTNKYTKHANI